MQTSLAHDRAVGLAIRSPRRLYRDALAACLGSRPEFSVVGHVGDDADLLQLCKLRSPELVLFDAGSSIAESLGPLGELHSGFARIRVVVVYERITSEELTAAWKLGVDTLVPCSHGFDALLVVLQQRARFVRAWPEQRRRETGLTDTEREIITLIGAGHPVSRIAELLGVSACAVENSKRRIYHKLQVVSQSHAIARASALGLMDRPPPQPKAASLRPGGVALAALRGPDGPLRDRVVVSLLSSRIPFVIDRSARLSEVDTWDRWHAGPVLVVLVDPEPSDWKGIDKLRVPVLLVNSRSLPRGETLKALGRGLTGILAADDVEDALAPALVLAAAGYLLAGPESASELGTVIRARSNTRDDGLPELTVRESEILRSIAAGDTVRQTARTLGIAEKTVENTQARLFRKLGTHNRAGAVAMAHALGLLDLPMALPARRAQ